MGSRTMRKYRGSCHFAAQSPSRSKPISPGSPMRLFDLPAQNALMVKDPRTPIHAADRRRRLRYRFHTMTARHFFCRICGIYPFHRKRVTHDFLGANVYCLESFDPAGIPSSNT